MTVVNIDLSTATFYALCRQSQITGVFQVEKLVAHNTDWKPPIVFKECQTGY